MNKRQVLISTVIVFTIFLTGCTNKVVNKVLKNNRPDPAWVQALADKDGKHPGMEKCDYGDGYAYSVIPPCCDAYFSYYDENHQVICSPGGGITGKGSGEPCPETLTNCQSF